MSQNRLGMFTWIRSAVTLATVFAMALGVVAPVLAVESATFAGAVMSPDNSFAQGFTVVFRDVATGKEFKSGPTSATGEYQVSVPTGGRYKLDSVLAPDGTKLPVQNVPPIPVRVAGSSRLDVKFTNVAAPDTTPPPGTAVAAKPPPPSGTVAAKPPAPAAKPVTPPPPKPAVASAKPLTEDEKKKKNKGGSVIPWWKKPGPIVGMVLGGAALAALALSGGSSNDEPASASK